MNIKLLKKFNVFIILFCCINGTYAEVANPARNLIIPKASITSNTVTLLWDKPNFYDDIVSYQVFQNGKLVGESTKTNHTVKKLKSGKNYSFHIVAKNKNGETSEISNKATGKTKAKSKIFNVLDYGAIADDKTINTIAIQKAIDACSKGGTVYIPKGKFLSGALYLKSDMTLLIEKDGVLKGSKEIKDYLPFNLNRFEGWEMETFASLINAGKLERSGSYNVSNLSIMGEGTISGGGSALGNAMIKANGIRSRGRLFCIMNGQNINIQGLNIENAPCWTIHYIYSDQVTLHDLNIVSTARNGDGIDPDSSTDSYIFNCDFSTGDDCIAIKSGKNPEGYYVGKPTRNIRITDCNFIRGHSLAIGSEMSGGVSDVFIQDCKIGNLLHGLQIKATKDRGGYVKNVIVRDCELLKVTLYTAVNYNNDGEAAPVLPQFSDMEFSNLDLTKAKPNEVLIDVNGFEDEQNYTKNILFKNISLPNQSIIRVKNGELITFKEVKGLDNTRPEYKIIESKEISY